MAQRDPVQTLVGFILPDKEDSDDEPETDDEVEETEEQQPEFLDMKEITSLPSGGWRSLSSLPAMTEGKFLKTNSKRAVSAYSPLDFMAKKECRVQGRFALKDPWWQISCTARRFGHKFVMKGYPFYSLRTRPKEESRTIVPLFLKESDVDPQLVTEFMKWLPEDRHVDLTNVEEALNDFGNRNKKFKESADFAISALTKSAAGFYVRAAIKYPHFMKYVPTLLPGQFLNLLKRGKEEETKNTEVLAENQENISILAKLEELIKTEVWKLGFGHIMWKEFRLVRCEAKVEALKDCKLFSKIPLLQQNALLAYDDLKTHCRQKGHTYIERKHLEKRMMNLKIPEESTWDALDFLRKQGVLIVERQKIVLGDLFRYETEIADCLSKLARGVPWKIKLDVKEVLRSAHRMRTKGDAVAGPSASEEQGSGVGHEPVPLLGSVPNLDDSIDEEPDPTPIELDPDQVRAAEMICANPVTVISGKGGCGKTTVVSLIFKAAIEQQKQNTEADSSCEESKENGKESSPEVLLTAPTGRAASLLTKKTGFPAYTMHQVWWNFMDADKDPSGKPVNWKFAHVRVLVVDEGSLVCLKILHSLLTMLTKHAKLQKFILLGDIRQLPSIEPGNALNDLFQSLQKIGWATEMRTNHRAESERIVKNAELIAEMGCKKIFHPLNFDACVDLSEPFSTLSPEKKFIHIILPENRTDLKTCISKLLKDGAPGLKDHHSSQFIAFTRKNCALINEVCWEHYSDHPMKKEIKKINFQDGDKVCCTRNGYVTDIEQEEEMRSYEKEDIDGTQRKAQKNRLCNGEIFFLKWDRTIVDAGRRYSKKRTLRLCNESNEVVLTADYRELQRECKLRHAWARTIHAFQGSEQKTIVFVLENCSLQNWKHVYTAVTRGQERVYIIAKTSDLKKVMPGQVINRSTRLAGLITEMVSTLRAEREDLFPRPNLARSETPKQNSSFQRYQSPLKTVPNPGQSQTSYSPIRCSAWADFKDSPGQNQYSTDDVSGGCNFSKSGSPSIGKRQSSNVNNTTPNKKQKAAVEESPLGCTRLELMSLNGLTPKAKQHFPRQSSSTSPAQQEQE